ncbi:hypothetical protein Dimus_003617, partial [Dionaea muscipula]
QAVATEEAKDLEPPPKKKRVLTKGGVVAPKAKEQVVDATKAIVPMEASQGKARAEKKAQDKGKREMECQGNMYSRHLYSYPQTFYTSNHQQPQLPNPKETLHENGM